jgi:glycosyltransferase involved in cell wall biosynthesis
VIWVQDPPIIAAWIVWLYSVPAGAQLIIDSHTDALLARWWQWSMPLHRFLSRRALCTIVTNDHLQSLVESWGATAFVLADVPTEFQYRDYPLGSQFNIAMVSSFSYDEPLRHVFAVARRLPDIQFHITGDLKLAQALELHEAPPNVHLTGFLPFEDYYGLLAASDAVLVLTTEDHTLQWGACEAVSLGKPVIISDWPFLRSYFHKGTVHVDNTEEGIYQGLLQMRRDLDRLGREVQELREERRLEWDLKYDELMAMIEQAASKSGHSGK